MNENNYFLGIVQNGQFQIVTPNPVNYIPRLTGISMMEARSPESAELSLTGYEGKAIMVHGHESDPWIYSAEVIDQGGPILTAVVRQLFEQTSGLHLTENPQITSTANLGSRPVPPS